MGSDTILMSCDISEIMGDIEKFSFWGGGCHKIWKSGLPYFYFKRLKHSVKS
jgi:hypothetical protein